MIDFTVYAVTIISIWAVQCLSLNLQFGLTGLVNFGQILPFALGAYGAGFAAVHGLPIWSGVLIGLALAPLVGLLVIVPARRMAQDYWALITLGAGEIFRLFIQNVSSVAGGVEGASLTRIDNGVMAMGLAVALLAVVWLGCWRISAGPLGRLLRVLREDETLVATLGRNPRHYQDVIIVLSWFMAAAAGVLYAHATGYISPGAFMVTETFVLWTAVVVGGPGRNLGVVLGAALVELLSVSTRFIAQWTGLSSELVANLRLAADGLALVLIFLYRPQGLFPETKKAYHVERD